MTEKVRTYLSANSIISSLGITTDENIAALYALQSGVRLTDDGKVSDLPLMLARIDENQVNKEEQKLSGIEDFSRLEKLFVLAIKQVIDQTDIDIKKQKVGLIISSTKGNIASLKVTDTRTDGDFLWGMAQKVADYFSFENRVYVISNACISGVSAFVVGKRLIESGQYSHIVVAGGDELSHFITSGFLSFKSLSAERCKPYDTSRDGLNLGEAVAAVLLSNEQTEQSVLLAGGAVSNDANHISGPSRTGDGLYFAIQQAMDEAGVLPSDVDFMNAHGTATLYNDEMESKAIHLADLQDVPMNSLKPFFGHTLGASGVLETIVCMHEMQRKTLLPTLGFSAIGVPFPLQVSDEMKSLTKADVCVKMASGFGGCNAAIVLMNPTCAWKFSSCENGSFSAQKVREVALSNGKIMQDGACVFSAESSTFHDIIREAYKAHCAENMKFFKMDDLCKLAYVTTELLLKEESFSPQRIGILLANSAASLHTDLRHNELIHSGGDANSSPAVFVYTLPNVASGEVCIRHKIQGENTFFVMKEYNQDFMQQYAQIVMQKGNLDACLVGWCELLADNYSAKISLYKKK